MIDRAFWPACRRAVRAWAGRRKSWTCFLLLFSLCAFAQQGATKLLLPVKSGGLWGYADTARNMVIAPQFDFANPFEKKIAVVEKNKKAFAIDTTGKILTPGFDQLEIIEDTILSIYLNEINDTLGGFGIVNTRGFEILPPAYDETAKVNKNLYAFRKDSLWGIVNRDGRIVVPVAYDTIILFDFKYLLLKQGKKYGLVTTDGVSMLDVVYKKIYRPNSSLIAAEGKQGWGAIDGKGILIIPFEYDTIESISKFFVQTSLKDSIRCFFPYGGGNPTSYAYKKFIALDLFWLRPYDYSKNCGLMDTLGNLIVPVKFGDIVPAGNGNWFVMDKTGKWGMYSVNGKELLPPTFTRIQPFRPGTTVTLAYDGNLPGLINKDGEILEKPASEQIIVRGNMAKILHNDSSAVFLTISEQGKITERANYDQLRTIRIAGKEQLKFAQASAYRVLGMGAYVPKPDSISWYIDSQTQLYGLKNNFTGAIIIPPRFTNVQSLGGLYTIVEIDQKMVFGPAVDDAATYCSHLEGLVNDSNGSYILSVNYTSIFVEDLLRKHGFVGYVRAVLKTGQTALVSIDGTERKIPFTWIDPPADGYARFCVGGKWTIFNPGEAMFSVSEFIAKEKLMDRVSFGKMIDSKEFRDKKINIAGGKWGYMDSTGAIVVPAEYQFARAAFHGTGIVKKEKKYGMINMSGGTIIPCSYDGLGYLNANGNTTVLATISGIRYGYVDTKGNIVVPADLRKSESLGYGFVSFTRGVKYGVMNSKGETVCPETYLEIRPFSEGYAQVRKGKIWGYIDTTGQEVVAPIYENCGKFSEGLARVCSKQKWGFINSNGEVIIDFKYANAGDFWGAGAPAKTTDGFGIVSKGGKWLMKPKYRKILPLLGTNLFIVFDDYAQGLCRTDGKLLVAPRYNGFENVGEGRVSYCYGVYFGLLDTSGKAITNTIFGKIKPFSQHLAAVESGGTFGYINRNGTFIIKPQFRTAGMFSENRASVRFTGSSGIGFIDTTGKILFVLRKDAESIYPESEGKFLVLYKEKQVWDRRYFITRKGLLVNRIKYDDAFPFADGAARVKMYGKWGLVSFTGYNLIKPRFTELNAFEYGIARFQMRSTIGMFSLDGKEILPVKYDWISYQQELGMIRFEKGNALGYMFPDGRICWAETE